jgi:hypothetical protein
MLMRPAPWARLRVGASSCLRSQLLAFERAESLLLGFGETRPRSLRLGLGVRVGLRKLPGARKFPERTLAGVPAATVTGLATGGWRRRRDSESAGVGIGEWRDTAAAQSDHWQRRGASESA